MTYNVRVIRRDDDFAALEARWSQLVARAADANTFLTHHWLYTWWCAYRPRADLRIVVAEEDGCLRGIAPMMLTREGGISRVIRRLRFVGDGTSETDHMNFIVDIADRERIVDALLEGIEGLPWQLGHFSHMLEHSENTRQLLQRAEARGWLTDTWTVPCPRIVLPRHPDGLLKALPSRLRTAIRSARRDLARHHDVEFGMLHRQQDLPEALESLYRNHASRWQAKGEQGVFVDPRKREFYAALSRKLLNTDSLRFYYLKVDGRTVAQQFCFEHSGTVLLLQEGFDMAWAASNVGNVLRAMVLEHLVGREVHAYDFLAGMSRHKRHWSNSVANDLHVRSFRRTLTGRVLHGLVQLKHSIGDPLARKG
jgi:CelD/BcsL family acetyltransferase involved in cellulose biosynthesis